MMRTLKSVLLLSSILLPLAVSAKEKDLNNCSIGVCNFELIGNPSLDQFQALEEQISSINDKMVSKDLKKEIEIKKTSECKKVSKEQFFHMFYMGQPQDGSEYDYHSNVSNTLKYKKLQAISKDYIIYEVELRRNQINATIPNMKAKDSNYTYDVTLIQKRGSCELVKYVKGSPFNINR